MWTGSMHRLRKKSDAKRGQAPILARPSEEQGQDSPASRKDPHTSQSTPKETTIDFLSGLPDTSDFRTSLILPDLHRRFSILRVGDQATLDDLKNRFAEQRARGAVHQITEEEEDMLLDALGRFRTRGSAASRENVASDGGGQDGQSVMSGASMNNSVVSSPRSNRSKRYSNNLFGSGRLRDYAYMKSVSSGSTKPRSTSTSSITPTESSVAAERVTSLADSTSNASLRPVTPDGTMTSSILSSSAQTSPPETGSSVGFASGSAHVLSEDEEESDLAGSRPTSLEQTLSARLDPQALKRASLALQQAIRELEDETEDEIVLPRTVPVPRSNGLADQSGHVSDLQRDAHMGEAQTGMAITDDQAKTATEDKRASPLPPRTHGYVPGMMRPLTPRDFDYEKDRSHSTTPRATSPNMVNTPASSPPIVGGVGVPSISEVLEQNSFSTNSRQTPRPRTPSVSTAPLFIQRSPSSAGRNTPGLDDEGKKGEHIDFDSPLNSTLLARRRPISPLTTTPFQSSTSSRPSTPSNVTWNTSLSGTASILKSGTHVRNESWASDTGSDLQHTLDRHKAPQRNIKSPALPESPTLEGQGTNSRIGSGSYRPATPGAADRPAKAFSGNGDVFSSNRSQRSPTPTQNGFRSPNASAFGSGMDARGSRRTSRQNAPSPWGYNVPSPLMFNSFANSSRSSIDSTGSSYHSWEGDKDKEWLEQLLSGEEPGPVWHDLSDRRTEPPLTDSQAEELSRKYFGLTLADLMAIQDKLVSIAAAKTASGEFVIRKRRPSTSQSNYVPPRVASPTQPQVPSSPTIASTPAEQYSKKASALLNSVVNDIQSKLPPPIDTTSPAVQAASPREPSPGTRRNRALAKILFGLDEAEAPVAEKPSPVSTPPVDDVPSNSVQLLDLSPPAPSSQQPPQQSSIPPPQPIVSQHQPSAPIAHSQHQPSAPIAQESSSPAAQSPYGLTRNPSIARVPLTTTNEADLAREIQQKSEAATAALKSASKSHLPGDGLSHSASISRKRINISQISKPVLLVSPTTSVDDVSPRTPTLSANNSSGASKIGSRFKRLRGSLRAKTHSPLSEQTTPPQTSELPSSQLANYDPAKLEEFGSPVPGSATEAGRPKVTVPSPPASAGPGLKGFISRFRGKQRASDSSSAAQQRGLQQSPSVRRHLSSTLSSTSPEPPAQRLPAQEVSNTSNPKPESARQPPATTELVSELPPPTGHVSAPSTSIRQSVMIQQLFDAANNLGLDQNALQDLLLRSGSTSSRPTKPPHSNLRPDSRLGQRGDAPISIVEEGDISQSTIIPPRSETPGSASATFGNSGGTRPLVLRSDNERRSRDIKDNPTNPIVRRTLIVANDSKPPTPTDMLQRVPSANRRRRGSVNSVPVKERAPTPPPPRSPNKQRFSTDNSPPVPALPGAFLSASSGANIEKPNSTYDSLYEMYAGGEQRTQTPIGPDSGNAENFPDPGHAVELIEYANGDTIWSIVSGLREDDDESIYTSRGSFVSEYAPRELSNDRPDNMQVFFKEHKRTGSKGSYNSFALKQKKANAQAKSRPETKVFYSSATQIGRLIENISQGMDAGTFQFSPPPRPGHSASSSLSTNDNWTVEERLEYMLGSMKSS